MAPALPSSAAHFVRPVRSLWPWVGLCLGLALTGLVWGVVHQAERARLEGLRKVQSCGMVKQLEDRMKDLSQVLHGAAGYLGRGPLPTRAEWHTYVSRLNLPATYPGFQGLSFVAWIPRAEQQDHLRRLRGEGFPDYEVLPGGPLPPDSEGASSIIYLEPMDALNQRAFGRDMLREASRREAMLQARDLDQVILSGPVRLYQESGSDPQVGLVLFTPVYLQASPLDTVAQRRQALRGWTTFPLRMGDLIRTTLARDLRTMDLALFDATGAGAPILVFDTDPEHDQAEKAASTLHTLQVAGRTWSLHVHPNASFYAETGRKHHWEILIGGVLASLLLFALLLTMRGAEARAVRLATLREQEVLATEAQFRALFERAPFGMAIVDSTSGRFLSVNQRQADILGHSREELLAGRFQDFTHPDHLEQDLASVRDLASGSVPLIHKEKRYLHRDGHEIWARLSMVRLPSAEGAPPRHLSIVDDITERKQLEEALRQREKDLSQAQEIGGFGSWKLVMSGEEASWTCSQGLRRIYGLPPDAPITMETGLAAMHPDDRERTQRAWQAAMNGTGPSEWEHRILVEGKVRWLSVKASFQFAPDGSLVEATGTVHDITERRSAEDALRASESRLRILGDQLPDSFLYQYLSKPGESPRFLYLSAGVERLCGLKAEEVVREPALLFDQVDPAMMPAYLEAEAISARDVTPFAMDLRQRHVDGRWRWFRVRSKPRPQSDGSVLWEGISTDVTELQEGRILLEESEARFRSVVDHAVDAIYLHDEQGRIQMCNAEACRMTGYSEEELLRLSVAEVDFDSSPERDTALWAGLSLGGQARLETHHRRKDGSSFPVEVHLGLLREEPQKVFLAMVRDLSAREQVRETELRARKAESLVLMAGSIAHDFNNIFQGALGFLEVAGIRAGENAELRLLLSKAEGSLRKAIELSWKMLDFSGRALVKPARLDPETWLPAFAATLQLDLTDALQIDLCCEPTPAILADHGRLEEALKSLVANAREAAEPGPGRIQLRLFTDFGADLPGPGSSGVWPLERPGVPATVCLEVADDGPGVPAAILDRICDPFFGTRALGRGLGLASVVGILRAHGAGLHLFNREGGGLVVRIHFPPDGA